MQLARGRGQVPRVTSHESCSVTRLVSLCVGMCGAYKRSTIWLANIWVLGQLGSFVAARVHAIAASPNLVLPLGLLNYALHSLRTACQSAVPLSSHS